MENTNLGPAFAHPVADGHEPNPRCDGGRAHQGLLVSLSSAAAPHRTGSKRGVPREPTGGRAADGSDRAVPAAASVTGPAGWFSRPGPPGCEIHPGRMYFIKE